MAVLAAMMFFRRLSAKRVTPPARAARDHPGAGGEALGDKGQLHPRRAQKVWSFRAFSSIFLVSISSMGAYMLSTPFVATNSVTLIFPLDKGNSICHTVYAEYIQYDIKKVYHGHHHPQFRRRTHL